MLDDGLKVVAGDWWFAPPFWMKAYMPIYQR